MMNNEYFFRRMEELIEEYVPSRQRTQAKLKLEECALWLSTCTRKQETVERDTYATPMVTAEPPEDS